MKLVPRTLATTLDRACRSFPAILVTGPRQSGKTTLLRQRFGKTHTFVSLERPDIRARALADPVGFLDDHPGPVILDEIQNAPGLLPYVKDSIDNDRRAGRWLFTGSQNFALMEGISQTLAGRVAVLVLDPLTVSESRGTAVTSSIDVVLARVFGTGKPTTRRMPRVELGHWLLRGGFPELCLRAQVDRELWIGSYIQTYLERDVRGLLQVGDLASFQRFLTLVASRSGSILNMTNLGREVGVTGPTAKRWLSVLEASHLIYLLRPYHRNFGKRITKSPKVYVLDPCLVTFLTGLHAKEAVLKGPSIGSLLETAVIAEWLRAYRGRGERPELYYFHSGALEVDLVIERNGKLYGMEVKATQTPVPRHAGSLAQWLELTGGKARGALACQEQEPGALDRNIRVVPWHLAW